MAWRCPAPALLKVPGAQAVAGRTQPSFCLNGASCSSSTMITPRSGRGKQHKAGTDDNARLATGGGPHVYPLALAQVGLNSGAHKALAKRARVCGARPISTNTRACLPADRPGQLVVNASVYRCRWCHPSSTAWNWPVDSIEGRQLFLVSRLVGSRRMVLGALMQVFWQISSTRPFRSTV